MRDLKALSKAFTAPATAPVSLCLENLAFLPVQFDIPRYNPADVTSSILHIGPSNFARAHIAKMAHDTLNAAADAGAPLNFGIKAVSLKSADAKHALAPQDNLYTLTSKGAGCVHRHEVIGSVRDVVCAKEDADTIIAAAADPTIKIITMTVTQNGYDASKSQQESFKILDPQNPEFSTIKLLVHSLNERRKNGGAIPVVVSLDNMNGNGVRLKTEVIKEAGMLSRDLADWIDYNVPFPSTMVDRITPSKSQAHADEIIKLGVSDNTPVLAEPMPHVPLVIEDLSGATGTKGQAFRDSGIMRLADAGAIFSDNVARYESMKLRMLNGAHMALGCVGTLSGYKTTDEAMKDPQVRCFVGKFMDQVISTLEPIPGVDYKDYKADLINRLDNPHICDPLTRLARNGISKVFDRVLDTVRGGMANGTAHDCVTFTVAAWLHYAGKLDAKGHLPGVSAGDPNEKDFLNQEYTRTHFIEDIKKHAHTINAVFCEGRERIWGADLMSNARFINEVKSQFELIEHRGIENALKMLVGFDQVFEGPAPGVHLH